MFSEPRTWTQGESNIRYDSYNKSLPENLDAFRSLLLRRRAVSLLLREQITVERTSGDVYSTWQYFDLDEDATAVVYSAEAAIYGMVGPNRKIHSAGQSPVLWLPIGNISAIKKSTESIYVNVSAELYYNFAVRDSLDYSLASSNVTYEYLGSDTDTGKITAPEKSIPWSATLSGSGGLGEPSILLETGDVLLDLSDMSTTETSLCAYRFRIKQYGMPPIQDSGEGGFGGSDTLSCNRFKISLVVK